MKDKLTPQNILLLVLVAVVGYLLFKDINRPVVVDYGPDIKAMQEKQTVYDAAINDFNRIEDDVAKLRNERKQRHETINHVRAANSDSLRRAHLTDLLNRAE